MATRTITVLDPTAKSRRKEMEMAVRPQELEGKAVGVVWNSKPGGDVLLGEFVEQLTRRFRLSQVLNHRKPSPALGISELVLNEFSRKCDFVIVGIGD